MIAVEYKPYIAIVRAAIYQTVAADLAPCVEFLSENSNSDALQKSRVFFQQYRQTAEQTRYLALCLISRRTVARQSRKAIEARNLSLARVYIVVNLEFSNVLRLSDMIDLIAPQHNA
jgi:hypothetical protein